MSLRLGDDAPNFKVDSSQGEIDFYEFNDKGARNKAEAC